MIWGLTFQIFLWHTTFYASRLAIPRAKRIRELIAAHPGASRRRLSSKLCAAWGWNQANGAPRDMVCRGLLLMLDRAGEIALPPVRFTPRNPLARRERPRPVLRNLKIQTLNEPVKVPNLSERRNCGDLGAGVVVPIGKCNITKALHCTLGSEASKA